MKEDLHKIRVMSFHWNKVPLQVWFCETLIAISSHKVTGRSLGSAAATLTHTVTTSEDTMYQWTLLITLWDDSTWPSESMWSENTFRENIIKVTIFVVHQKIYVR